MNLLLELRNEIISVLKLSSEVIDYLLVCCFQPVVFEVFVVHVFCVLLFQHSQLVQEILICGALLVLLITQMRVQFLQVLKLDYK